MTIEPIASLAKADWLKLRKALWPEGADAEHEEEMAELLANPSRFGQFLARSDAGTPIGLAEVSVRTDYVNGTESSAVAFLEGLYVAPQARRAGVARALVQAVRTWALAQGCTELASDTQLENTLSQAVHTRLGFIETERVVYFNMVLQQPNAA
ncbi:GNAT family N-acetyltransferase [Pseudomonas aeruginosa]|nr:GNAT family N-acetyltransferase [Pseudomonas aeruginosa]EKU7877943.1 GNAT family N-acetyltransferase [Pseudomonas aeruginosa]EKV3202553.1 GNAT family N-acetyltransferase [Pseudomonas aeruginosa]MBI7135791.1 GNAT family N-acetyltransferase [Pseudomonas aeruginosa]MBI7148046.1 GNAT family N-acetyltransferase [Pseudomonas aeruginosa]